METIEEIVREMRDMRQFYGSVMREYADRLEAAENVNIKHENERLEAAPVSSVRTDNSQVIVNLEKKIATLKREITLKQKQHTEQGRKYREKIRTCNSENARLKAALQPVLDIVMDSATSDLSMELAITEAKRIYNEGKEESNGSK